MNRYETLTNNKRMFIIYSVGGQAGVFIDWLRNGCIESPQRGRSSLLANTIKLLTMLKFIEKSPILSMNFSFLNIFTLINCKTIRIIAVITITIIGTHYVSLIPTSGEMTPPSKV